MNDLADKAKVSRNTIINLERARKEQVQCRQDTLKRVRAALEKAGVEFINDTKPGVRLRRST